MPDVRPPHRDPRLLALVAAGGAIGSVLRYAVGLALSPTDGGWPWPTFAVNVVGALVLGWLLTALARRGPESRPLRAVRLFVGTGVLGGFTTYSALGLELTRLAQDAAWGVAVAYAAATLVVGTTAALLGVLVGSRTPPGTVGRLLRAEDRS